MKIHYVLILLIAIACGVPQPTYDRLVAENEKLKVELDDCANGEGKLIAIIDKAYNEKDFVLAKEKIYLLETKFPESPKNKEYKLLLPKIREKAEELEKKRIAEEKEKTRLANINNLGIWYVNHYVDDFGQPTKKGYITNLQPIKGTFSNTATQNSDLNVTFLIDSKTDISFQLYEYAGNNPVKTSGTEIYNVSIRDGEGKTIKFNATNYSDRISLRANDSNKLHNMLMKGGKQQFSVYEVERSTSTYRFDIEDASYYDNAYTRLTAK